MTEPLPSPKSRLRAVYTVPEDEPARSERVVYQLEDMGDPVLRLRASVRQVDEDGETRYLYRLDAFSRLSGKKLDVAELVAPLGSPEAFDADSRQFQSGAFQGVLAALRVELVDRHSAAEAALPPG